MSISEIRYEYSNNIAGVMKAAMVAALVGLDLI